ncbi:LysR family transcriptional regulator [Paraburkholderia caribensis]|uniref:LysR family transcriptional regulator n=1 Tax=Paraburkholderia caribensis TaxID=75105 RepID=UPI001590B1F1|nr:LysR family transcriptional regulator [Paraburkholderia caribensis]
MDLLAAMRIFVRVVERGNLSRAAKDLGLGQPAVSDRIERLEQYLGVRLLLRSTRSVSCTDEGSLFYQRSKGVLDAADEARAVVSQGNKIVRGRVRIAAPHGLGDAIMPKIVSIIREQNPQLHVDLILNDDLTDPVTEGVDISLRLGQVGDGNFVAHRLGHIRRVLVAAPEYIAVHGCLEDPTDLIRHPFIRVTGLFSDGQLRLVNPPKAPRAVPINIVTTISHWGPVYELLLDGCGIGVLQEIVCADALKSGRLVKLLPNHTVQGFDLHALLPPARQMSAKTQIVVSILKEHLPDMVRISSVPQSLDSLVSRG